MQTSPSLAAQVSPLRRIARYAVVLLLLASGSAQASDYYVSPSGNDGASGASIAPWRTINKVNNIALQDGDRVLFQGGQKFSGKIYLDPNDGGTSANPVTITSYGSGRATIDGGNGDALMAYNCGGIDIRAIDFLGAGRATNTGAGISIFTDNAAGAKYDHVYIDAVDCSGFRNGICFGSWHASWPGFRDVRITNARCHDNARQGLLTYGMDSAASTTWCHSNFHIAHCTFDNNPGDPSLTTNHSGSGCILGQVDNALIERCSAFNNGALNAWPYSGPVGIWAYESNRITIQYCESYSNRTRPGAPDGGGFDFDGGATNCVGQYNYSHDNEGPGFLICEYGGSRASANNIVRYNVIENDSRMGAQGGVHIYLGSDTQVYGNTIYSDAAITGAVPLRVSGGARTVARNNIFVTRGLPCADVTGDTVLQGNAYWNYTGGFDVRIGGSYGSLAALRAAGYERLGAADTGRHVDPMLTAAGAGGTIGNPDNLGALTAYLLLPGSPMVDAGVDLVALGITTGGRDYWGDAAPQGARPDIGADETSGFPPPPPAPPAITSAANATGKVGQAFSYTITASNAPTGFSATGLPAGLSVNPATGAIAGTPTAAGTSTVTIGASNAGGTGSATLTITVTASVASGTAAYLATDTTTKGTWRGVYGGDGFHVFNDVASYPAYAQVTVTGAANYVWGPSNDIRALQRAAGSERLAACYYSGGSFDIDINLTDGQVHRLALYAIDWDGNNTRAQTIQVLDAGNGAVLDSRALSSFSAGTWLAWNLGGHVVVRVTSTGALNGLVSGLFFGGAGGGGVAQDSAFISQSFPAQMTAGTTAAVSVTMRNTGTATWIRSQGYRLGSQSPADNITWGAYRAELPGDIAPGGTATISFTITAPSTPGSYGFQWRMLQESVAWFGASSANVAIPVIADGGSGGSATFIAADTVTQGSWQGTYGADGHQLFLDATALPSYAQVSVADASYWNWNNATSDVRALQRPSDSSRIAACAYSNGSFTIDVNLTDGQSHRVALYAVDWDSNGVRSQVVEVLDTAGKVLDSRAIGPFTNGTWLVWNLQGHVALRLTNAAGQWNAVASGLFFGGAGGDVVVAPAITQGPGDASVQAGHPATFSVAASGTSPSFQWQVAIAGSNAFANITGATASSYTTPATVGSDSGKRYRCSASNSAGSVASAAATLTVVSDQPPSSQPVLINFQPAAAAIPAGYLVDSGARFAARGNGQTYGWNKIVSTTDCNSVRSPDQRYDTFSAMQRNTWEIALANGYYSVRIVAGDANAASGSYRISAEGVLVVDASITSSGRWLDTTATVQVNDGRLTLKGGSTGTRICLVEIIALLSGNG